MPTEHPSKPTPKDRWDPAVDGRTVDGEPLLVSDLRRVLEELLDHLQNHHPGIDYSVSVSEFWEEHDLPRDADRITRTVNGKEGYYTGYAYRGTLIDRLDSTPWLVAASALDGAAPNHYADLRNGQITTELPPDAPGQNSAQVTPQLSRRART